MILNESMAERVVVRVCLSHGTVYPFRLGLVLLQ
jgi:hypothetical protein